MSHKKYNVMHSHKVPCLGLSFLTEASSLICPEIFPQTTVCTASVHVLPCIIWYINASDGGVVGGSGTAATV